MTKFLMNMTLTKEVLMNTKSKLALALIATAFAATAFAQQARAGAGALVTSEPGKARSLLP